MTPVLLGLLRNLPRGEVLPTVALPSRHPALGALKRAGIPCLSFPLADYPEGLCRLIRRRRIQLVHSCDPGGEGGRAARRCRIPHLWEIPGIPDGVFPRSQTRGGASFNMRRDKRPGNRQALPLLAALLADAVVVHCRDLERKLSLPSLRGKLHVIPPVSVNAGSLPPPRKRIRGKTGLPPHRCVAMVANFYPAKRHLDFLRAAARIHREEPSVRFAIAGRCVGLQRPAFRESIRYRDRIAGAARQGPLGKSLVLTCFRPSQRFSWMQGVDILVTPSFEGLSQAMVEAAACGIPIVAARVGGQKDVLEHGRSGFLVPLGNSEAIAKAALRLLRNPRLAERMGMAGRRRVLVQFSAERQARRFLQLYRKILRSPHQRTRRP